jgi:hypothetical protein
MDGWYDLALAVLGFVTKRFPKWFRNGYRNGMRYDRQMLVVSAMDEWCGKW